MPTKTRKLPKKTKALKPQSGQTKPQSARVWFTRTQTAGINVTPDTALTYATYWACVKYISDAIATLPLDHRTKKAKGGSESVDSDASYLLNVQANPETQADVFRQTIIAHALNWGNGYAEIEPTLSGRPAWLWQITPDRVKVDRVRDTGQLVYDIANPTGPNTVLPPERMLHIKGLGFDGIVGYAVIAYAAKSIGGALAADTTASTLYENDSTPGGLLKHPRRLSENARKDTLESWQKRHGGPQNKRVVALLEEGMEWQQTSMPPEASQLIENRQYGPVDICRWFLVPPHKVGILDRATFSNIESQQIQAVQDCLMPWIIRIEKELDVKLIGRNLRVSQFFKHNLKGLLRADSQMRGQLYQLMLDRGVDNINEVRELEDMNPIGPDGEKRFVQRNMITLDQAGMPEPAPSGISRPASPQDMPEDQPGGTEKPRKESEPMTALLTPIIADSMKRIINRELRLTSGVNVRESLPNIQSKQAEYIRENLKSAVTAFAKTINPMSVDAVAYCSISVFLQQYDKDIEDRCTLTDKPNTNGLADHYTAMLARITTAMANS